MNQAGAETVLKTGGRTASAWVMLAVATAGFALNFWAWAMLSPLGP